MKNLSNFIFGLILIIIVSSCAERAVCPAYQSAFIHDKSTLDRQFSYFGEDSLPKVQLTASKNKFLLIDKVPYKKKVRSFNTIPMKTVYPVLEDSTLLAGDVQMLAEMDVVDSIALDSTIQNELPWKEKFNVEQEYYFHYMNDILVYPEERAQAVIDAKNSKSKMKGESNKKTNFFTKIFGSLFKKDKKSDLADSETEKSNDQSIDSEEKKGLFGRKNKDKNTENNPSNPAEEDKSTKPVENESDGEDDF